GNVTVSNHVGAGLDDLDVDRLHLLSVCFQLARSQFRFQHHPVLFSSTHAASLLRQTGPTGVRSSAVASASPNPWPLVILPLAAVETVATAETAIPLHRLPNVHPRPVDSGLNQ